MSCDYFFLGKNNKNSRVSDTSKWLPHCFGSFQNSYQVTQAMSLGPGWFTTWAARGPGIFHDSGSEGRAKFWIFDKRVQRPLRNNHPENSLLQQSLIIAVKPVAEVWIIGNVRVGRKALSTTVFEDRGIHVFMILMSVFKQALLKIFEGKPLISPLTIVHVAVSFCWV